MLTEVVRLLGPRYVSLIRSASSKGFAAFGEIALCREDSGAVVYTLRGVRGESTTCEQDQDEDLLFDNMVVPIDLASRTDWGDTTIYANVKVWVRTATAKANPTVTFGSRVGNLILVRASSYNKSKQCLVSR